MSAKANPLTKPQQTLILAATLSAICFVLPMAKVALLPLVYLNTHIHELFHALAALATQGSVGDIKVFGDGSGVTSVSGGWTLIVGSAGYVGSSIAGGWMIYLSRNGKSASRMMTALALILAISMVVLVRGDLVGIISGAFWVLVLAYAGQKMSPNAASFAGQFIGIQQCVNAFQSLQTLVEISGNRGITSDAVILQHATGLPAIVWAISWVLLSVIIVVLCLRRAWANR